MKKKKIIISICLVLLMSAFAVVEATSGDENNVFETLKALITGNTNRIEKLENEVNSLESEINSLKGQITELQKPKEEKETQNPIENKDLSNSNGNSSSNKKSSNTASKKTTSNNTNKKTTATTTTITDYKKQVDTLNTEIETLKKNIDKLEKQDNKQTKDIEILRNELNSKCEELKQLVKGSNNNSLTNTNNVLTKKDLVGGWSYNNNNITFNDNNTATITEYREEINYNAGSINNNIGEIITTDTKTTSKVKYVNNYTYTLEGNYVHLTLVNATKQVVGGTKIITTTNNTTGEKNTETVEVKAGQPVDNSTNSTKKIVYGSTIINNSLYLKTGTIQFVKNK